MTLDNLADELLRLSRLQPRFEDWCLDALTVLRAHSLRLKQLEAAQSVLDACIAWQAQHVHDLAQQQTQIDDLMAKIDYIHSQLPPKQESP